MKVEISFHDNTTLSADEVVKQMKHLHGKNTVVKVSPDSTTPHDLILFALEQMITTSQLELYFNEGASYPQKLLELRAKTLFKVEELLNEVILNNENRLE